jgi:hypothetical protein
LGRNATLLGAGFVLVGVALLVALTNALMRLALRSQRDREREAWGTALLRPSRTLAAPRRRCVALGSPASSRVAAAITSTPAA